MQPNALLAWQNFIMKKVGVIVSHLISTHPSTMISIVNQIQANIIGEAKVN
jgi:hypothetical protein